jgi:putative transposase
MPSLLLSRKPVISKEKCSSAYWDRDCHKLSSSLWLPASTPINYEVEPYSPRIYKIKSFEPHSLKPPSVLLLPVEKDAQSRCIVKATKKIRIFPEHEEKYHQAIALYRRAYNLAIERYKNDIWKDGDGKSIDMRPAIKAQAKDEQIDSGGPYDSMIVSNAVRHAAETFRKVTSSNKGKTTSDGLSNMSFSSKKKGSRHSFRMCRFPKGGHPARHTLGDIVCTEKTPDEAIGSQFTVSFEKGRWFINVQQHIKLKTEIQGKVRCVAIDPGARTFATCYSDNEVIVAGEDFAQGMLFPLMKKADDVLSQRQRTFNQFPKGTKIHDMPQWAQNRLSFLQKRFYRLKCKKDDLVRDMHQRLAYELVTHYDVIFLPTFETKQMVKRKAGRVIRRNTCRQMLSLEHYRFKLLLKWYAKKYGKVVVDVNESHTTKTLSWSGEVLENIGGKKQVGDGKITVDRDINAARGIYIKTISQAT